MIGIFDSGSGGLTVLSAIRDRFPSIDVLYYGDIKNAPYGSKSREELSALTVHALKFLSDRGCRSIVSACNSVSASLAVSLFDSFDVGLEHLIEMVGPTVRAFRGTKARLALCATPATIQSGIYQNAFTMIGKQVEYISIDNLAGAIEFGKSESEIEGIVRQAFPEYVQEKFDVLILACTHYPLVLDVFKRVLGDKVSIFDPALVVAERVETQLWPREMGDGKTHFAISQDSPHFRTLVERLFPNTTYEIEVVE
ncbi:aspartate/glutamate racemase family protein [Candidatus Kaiserbacteria bacterium]|nr:aspartate/glutamate racemase family protein [Candidatus Kaiserbacteria bacterium]